jgi:hypothetical protein
MIEYLIFSAGVCVGVCIMAFFAGCGAADELELIREIERLKRRNDSAFQMLRDRRDVADVRAMLVGDLDD